MFHIDSKYFVIKAGVHLVLQSMTNHHRLGADGIAQALFDLLLGLDHL